MHFESSFQLLQISWGKGWLGFAPKGIKPEIPFLSGLGGYLLPIQLKNPNKAHPGVRSYHLGLLWAPFFFLIPPARCDMASSLLDTHRNVSAFIHRAFAFLPLFPPPSKMI